MISFLHHIKHILNSLFFPKLVLKSFSHFPLKDFTFPLFAHTRVSFGEVELASDTRNEKLSGKEGT